MLAPVAVAARKAVDNSIASRTGKQLFTAVAIYMTDSDDTYPVAMYTGPDRFLVLWFGHQTAPHEFDRQAGIISPYIKGFLQADPTHHARPYLGDGTGFGYNYGFLGSDFSMTGDYSHWPDCWNPASNSMLAFPSQVVTFATSGYFNAPWIPNGDGQMYDFGFIDPPSGWNGNPNVDFRHWDQRKIDTVNHKVTTTGRAVTVFADGHLKSLHETEIQDANFRRDGEEIR